MYGTIAERYREFAKKAICRVGSTNIFFIFFYYIALDRYVIENMRLQTENNDNMAQGGGRSQPSIHRIVGKFWKFLLKIFSSFLENTGLQKKSHGLALLEKALFVSLLIGAAIYGLGSLGQSIQKQLGLIFYNQAQERRERIYKATHDALIGKGVVEADASRIATAAADAAAAAYQAALNADGTSEEANRMAAWAAYTTAYDQTYKSSEIDTTSENCYIASEAAYKSAWGAYNGRESSMTELIYDRAYSAALEAVTIFLSTLQKTQMASLDVETIAASMANDFAESAYNAYTAPSDIWSATYGKRLGSQLRAITNNAQIAMDSGRNNCWDLLDCIAADAVLPILGLSDSAQYSYRDRVDLARWAEQMLK